MALTASGVAALIFAVIWISVRLLNFISTREGGRPPATPPEVRLWATLSIVSIVLFVALTMHRP